MLNAHAQCSLLWRFSGFMGPVHAFVGFILLSYECAYMKSASIAMCMCSVDLLQISKTAAYILYSKINFMHCKFLLFSFLSPGRTHTYSVNGAGEAMTTSRTDKPSTYVHRSVCGACLAWLVITGSEKREKQPAPAAIGNNEHQQEQQQRIKIER